MKFWLHDIFCLHHYLNVKNNLMLWLNYIFTIDKFQTVPFFCLIWSLVMTSPCWGCRLMSHWPLTWTWSLCLLLVWFCLITAPATSLDMDVPPVSQRQLLTLIIDTYVYINVKYANTSVSLYMLVSPLCTFSWWQHALQNEAGLPSCCWPWDLHQLRLVGQHCQGDHDLCWRRCSVRMQCEYGIKYYIKYV